MILLHPFDDRFDQLLELSFDHIGRLLDFFMRQFLTGDTCSHIGDAGNADGPQVAF